MYICDQCAKVVGPRVPMNRVVIREHAKSYPVTRLDEEGEPYQTTAWGKEIVQEARLCPECAGVERAPDVPIVPPAYFQEPQVRTFTVTLGAMLVEHLIEGAAHNTKRSQLAFEQAYPFLKAYEQRGGGI